MNHMNAETQHVGRLRQPHVGEITISVFGLLFQTSNLSFAFSKVLNREDQCWIEPKAGLS